MPVTRRGAAVERGTCALALGLLVIASPVAQGGSPFAALPLVAPAPADNPTTPEKVELGRLLFWDPVLSGGQDIACATCHHPDHGYGDGRPLPVGTGGRGLGPKRAFPGGAAPLVKRNSPTVLNVAFNGIGPTGEVDPTRAPMFWDSRARGLEAQALIPIESLEEMRGGRIGAGGAVDAAVERLRRLPQYRALFARAFGGPDAVTVVNLSRAIAAFERSLVSTDTPFDRYMRGDHSAMSPLEVRGMAAFDDHGCTLCHKGPMLSDYALHVIGVTDNPALGAADTGAERRYAFRTASLRNLASTAPYMHSGMVPDLASAVGFYKIVGGGGGLLQHFATPLVVNGHLVLGSPVGRDELDPLLRQVNVNTQLDDIVAFLGTLNGPFDRTIPSRVPSGLKVGGR
jgi:cytochrome c peroxidase